jgi:16S rRNA (cytosine1402-N4)-methyltransferase
MESIHKTVLLNETIEGLNLDKSKSSIIVDGTFGGGGHSKEILNRFPKVKIIALDQDSGALDRAKDSFTGFESRISFHNTNFRDIEKVLQKENIEKVDGIILDLGLSSDQLENSGRGFSFMLEEPLEMTMKANPSSEDLTARDIVNTWSEKSISDIIYGYGEEKFANKIAKAIVASRQEKKIETTVELVKIIENAVPAGYKRGRLHFATRTFQALRIAVNDELRTLSTGLALGFDALLVGGRMSVISFHSLEDRIVKKFCKEKQKEGIAKLINKKPILATKEELKENNRSRSAKLRILEKN